jgi:hypothetical protein
MALKWQPPQFEAVEVGGECTAYAAAVSLPPRQRPTNDVNEESTTTIGTASDVARTTGRTITPRRG